MGRHDNINQEDFSRRTRMGLKSRQDRQLGEKDTYLVQLALWSTSSILIMLLVSLGVIPPLFLAILFGPVFVLWRWSVAKKRLAASRETDIVDHKRKTGDPKYWGRGQADDA